MTTAERVIFVVSAAAGAALAALGLTWAGPKLIDHLGHRPPRPPEVWELERHGAISTTRRRV